MKRTSVKRFVSTNKELIDSVFVKNTDESTFGKKLESLLYLLRLSMYRFYSTIFLMFAEPLLVVSQLQLWRSGGLAGSYQFNRLYEIRSILKKELLTTGIEFGSGCSSILFVKYLSEFISIEESHQWRNSYLANISILRYLRPKFFAKIEKSILVFERTEYLDSTDYLVCSYRLPGSVINKKYDLVYVDGPTAWVQSERPALGKVVDPFAYLPNVSLLELKVLPTYIMVDGRRATLVHLLRNLENRNYDFLLKGSYLENPRVNPYHSTFVFSY
jgi:hypothetical protein